LILCVGIGNTNIRCAVGVKANYRHAVLETEKINSAEDFVLFLEEEFRIDNWDLLKGGIVSSVVPQKTPLITEAVRTKIQLQRTYAAKCNFIISEYNGNLGEDRAVCCAAALAKYKLPVTVIDLGTATTINVINTDHTFAGGVIMVGVQTGLTALEQNTAQLPLADDLSDIGVICCDTRKSLISGAVLGTVYAIEGYIKQIQALLTVKPTVIITGGNAPLIIPHCGFDFSYEPMLLIDGLFELYNEGDFV